MPKGYFKHGVVFTAGITAGLLALTGCTGGSSDAGDGSANSEKTVRIVTHDSFPAEDFAKAASEATGYTVEVVAAGDGGELTNKLVLTKDKPIADLFYGVDNYFASRLVDEDVVTAYTPADLPESAKEFNYDDSGSLTPIDEGAVCVNIDPAWFAEQGIAEPVTYEDLTKEEYKGLTVAMDPAGSSTGMAFLAGTVSKFGEDGFADYWKQLVANDVRIEQGWTEAYNGQFTQGGESGKKPIVVSYASSPAWTVNDDETETSTKALLETCSSQVEYAGILKGAENVEGAKAVIDYMVSVDFQNTIAESMYVYPVHSEAEVPEVWQKFAPKPTTRHDLSAAKIGESREAWLKTWSDAVAE